MAGARGAALADLAGRGPRRPSWRRALAFLACAGAVVSLFAAVGYLGEAYTNWVAESFGDRRLDAATPAECAIARAVVADLQAHEGAALLRSVGQVHGKLSLRAFAWRSMRGRLGRGVDWRKCQGFGPYVRHIGMARMASGEQGPMIYVSRAMLDAAGNRAEVAAIFRPPLDQGRAAARAWKLDVRRTAASGEWWVVRRTDLVPPPSMP